MSRELSERRAIIEPWSRVRKLCHCDAPEAGGRDLDGVAPVLSRVRCPSPRSPPPPAAPPSLGATPNVIPRMHAYAQIISGSRGWINDYVWEIHCCVRATLESLHRLAIFIESDSFWLCLVTCSLSY
jgi:hypothetical protein